MVSRLALVGLAAASLSYVSAYEPVARASNNSSYNHTCGLIAAAISNASDVYYPGMLSWYSGSIKSLQKLKNFLVLLAGSVGFANDIAVSLLHTVRYLSSLELKVDMLSSTGSAPVARTRLAL